MREKIKKWKLLGSSLAFNHRWYKVQRDKVKIAPRTIIDDYFFGLFPDIVIVCALTRDEKVPFVVQYKHGAGKILLELPAGYVDGKESLLKAAKRELLEETGYVAERWEKLGFFHGNPTKERGNNIHIFLARGARRTRKQKLDESEDLRVLLLSFEDALRKAIANKIKVGGSSLAVLLVALRIKKILRS